MASSIKLTPIVLTAALVAAGADVSAQEPKKDKLTPAEKRARAIAELHAQGDRAVETAESAEALDKKAKVWEVSRRELREQAEGLAEASDGTVHHQTDDIAVGTLVNNDVARGGGLGNVYEVEYETRTEDGEERKIPVDSNRRSDEDITAREEAYGKRLLKEMAPLIKKAAANNGSLSDEDLFKFLVLLDKADGDTQSYDKDQDIAARVAIKLGITGEGGLVKIIKEEGKVVRLDIDREKMLALKPDKEETTPKPESKKETPESKPSENRLPLRQQFRAKHSRRPEAGANNGGSRRGNKGNRFAGGNIGLRRHSAGASRR